MQNRRVRLRIAHVSKDQKNQLLRYLLKNPRLAHHRYSASFSVIDAKKEWKSLSTSLNSIPGRGSVKTWKQWRKSWQDLKSKTKMKFLQGNVSWTRDEKIIIKIAGGFGDRNHLPSNGALKLKTDESGIDTDESITPKQEKDNQENIIIHIVDSIEPQNTRCFSQVKTEYLAVSQNPDEKEEENDEESDVRDDMTADQCSDKKETDFKASYREKKLMYLGRIARAKERSAIAEERSAIAEERSAIAKERSAVTNERIADALERIALAGESII